MNEHSDQPTNDPTADRLRDAMQAQAASVQPADAWPTIVERLDGRRSPWAWIGQHPLVLGAGAVALALIAILTVNLFTGDEQAEDVYVGPPTTGVLDTGQTADAGPVVGARPDGSLALLDPETGAVDEELLAADAWPEAHRPATPEGEALLTELAVDGQDVFTTRPLDPTVSGVDCAEGEFQADWDVWRVPLAGDHAARLMAGGLAAEPWVLPPTAPPSRMPALSPEGSQIAYVTTSNGERCDGALMVAVADLSAPTDVLATHTLGIGIEPVGIDWTVDGRLVIQLVAGSGADFPGIIPVAVDPAVSGPVGLEDSPVALNSPVELAASADPEWLHLVASSLDDVVRVSLDEIYTDVMHEAPASVDLPVGRTEGAVVSLAVDSDRVVWVTVGLGQPVWPLTEFDSYRTYRWELPVRDELTEAVEVSDELIAVAASPFEVDRTDAEPTGTTMPVDPDTTDPTGTTIPASAGPEFVYVTGDGELVRGGIGGGSEVIAQLPTAADGQPLGLALEGTQLAATPDGRTLYVALEDNGGPTPTCSDGDIYAVDLDSGEATLLTNGRSPAVSPDGTRLAYSMGAESGDRPGMCQQSLVVQDLESGEQTVWTDDTAGETTMDDAIKIDSVLWTADGERLAFERRYPEMGASSVFITDVDAPAGALADRPMTLPDALPGDNWSLAGVLVLDSDPGGAIVVQPWCSAGPCEGGAPLQILNPDGSSRGEQPIDSRLLDAAVGSYGVIGTVRCDPEDSCVGSELWIQPSSGEATQVTDGSDLILDWAWLP